MNSAPPRTTLPDRVRRIDVEPVGEKRFGSQLVKRRRFDFRVTVSTQVTDMQAINQQANDVLH
jgi:hypothetical protein